MDVVILLVEDNPDDEALTLRALKKNNIQGKVAVARDGAEALEMLFGPDGEKADAGRTVPQLVLLDLKLPKVDGLKVLERLRADRRTHSVPVVVFTSSNEHYDVTEGYRLGANSYVRKPVDFGEFTEAVGKIVGYWLRINQAVPKRKI